MKGRLSFSRQRWLKIAMPGISALVLMAIVGLSYRQWKQFRGSIAEGARARDVRDSCDRVLSDLLDAETGQRGYLLTGENRYLDPYNQAVRVLPTDMATLKDLLAESQSGYQSFLQLNALVNDKLAELSRTAPCR